jgi:hypothetical protein
VSAEQSLPLVLFNQLDAAAMHRGRQDEIGEATRRHKFKNTRSLSGRRYRQQLPMIPVSVGAGETAGQTVGKDVVLLLPLLRNDGLDRSAEDDAVAAQSSVDECE